MLKNDIDFYSRFGNFVDRDDGWSVFPADREGCFSIVLCNIVVGPLCRVASTLSSLCAPGGCVILAGFRGSHMRKQVEEAYTPYFVLEDLSCEGEWGSCLGRKR